MSPTSWDTGKACPKGLTSCRWSVLENVIGYILLVAKFEQCVMLHKNVQRNVKLYILLVAKFEQSRYNFLKEEIIR